jgi:hypothetical protein
MSDDEERKPPTPPTKAALKEAQKEADAHIALAEKELRLAMALADKYGFGITILEDVAYGHGYGDDGYYYTPNHTDDSMWMPSDEEVEGSGYLDFHWASSTEGQWSTAADRDN